LWYNLKVSPGICREELGKPTNSLVRVVDVAAEIKITSANAKLTCSVNKLLKFGERTAVMDYHK
jgi:hypothetical protein